MRIISKFILRLDRYLARVKEFFGVDAIVKFNNFKINLPATHLLPLYQKNHRLYDRFLPHIASALNKGDCVIDVGANCGDTLASMFDVNPGLCFFCVEPDDVFFLYLSKNAKILRKCFSESEIVLEKSLVGKSVKSANLIGVGGTKRSVVGAALDGAVGEGLKSRQLDALFLSKFGEYKSVRLIKSDVDGFDFDVINSAEGLIRKWRPIIYFEMHCFEAAQKDGFESAIDVLASVGYSYWVVFDNFGEVVLGTDSPSNVKQLGEYVWRLNLLRSTRTVYYFDVLACCPGDVEFVCSEINSYLDL